MSEFIVIVPSDFVEVNLDAFCGATGFSIGALEQISLDNNYTAINESASSAGILPEGYAIHEFKIINGNQFWVKYVVV